MNIVFVEPGSPTSRRRVVPLMRHPGDDTLRSMLDEAGRAIQAHAG